MNVRTKTTLQLLQDYVARIEKGELDVNSLNTARDTDNFGQSTEFISAHFSVVEKKTDC